MEPYLGQIELFPYSFAPRSWTFCEGQTLLIQQNTALYALIGGLFGGDGKTTFALPDLRGKGPIKELRYAIAIHGLYPPRN